MNSIEMLTTFLGWSSVINVGLLLLSTTLIVSMRSWVSNIHGKMFGLSHEDLSRAYFQYLAQYKLAILAFNIAPYAALKIMA